MTGHLSGNQSPTAPVAPISGALSGAAAPKVSERGRAALELLLEARCFAQELDRSVWDFALEAERLRSGGLVFNDLRWLVCKGYLEHASEILSGAGEERRFHKGGALTFTETSCFVLTEPGSEFVQQLRQLNAGPAPSPAPPSGYPDLAQQSLASGTSHALNGTAFHNGSHYLHAPSPNTSPPACKICPRWDRDRQELRLGEFVVKQFKVPAPNQEMVIAVFQEEGWPPRIDDPLPPRFDVDPKRRLHDTINSLNRNQKTPLIRFLGDGSGQGVRWEPSEARLPAQRGDT